MRENILDGRKHPKQTNKQNRFDGNNDITIHQENPASKFHVL